MKITRPLPAPDRAEWEASTRAAAEKLGYSAKGEGRWVRGAWGGFHPEAARHSVEASWADGQGTWTAEASGVLPATRRLLEGRLDALEGKALPGSALPVLARAGVGGLLGLILAFATMFVFTIPLCREAREDWAFRQKMFEDRLDPLRAPIESRVRELPLGPAATIPALALGFLVAIPLGVWFTAGELIPALSRLNLVAIGVAMLLASAAFASPGVALPGLLAGLLAPLAATLGYGLVRGLFGSGRVPAAGPHWAIAFLAIVILGAAASRFSRGEAYVAVRDRILYGTKSGEALATFYYRNTPLSAYAVRPPELNPRSTALFAGGVAHGFPVGDFRMLAVYTKSQEEFLEKARGRGFTLIVYNEPSAPWVLEAAKELRRTHPGRAVGMVAVSKGGLEGVFPEAEAEQFVTMEMLANGRDKEVRRRVADAVFSGWSKADRRRELRGVSGTATTMGIFIGPLLILWFGGVGVAALVIRLRNAGLKRAAGLVAVTVLFMVGASVHHVATSEEGQVVKLRELQNRFEVIRAEAARDGSKWADLRVAAEKEIPELKLAAAHPSVAVRVLAMDTLGAAGQQSSFDILKASVMSDPSILVRYRAADAMGRAASMSMRESALGLAQNDEVYVAEGALDAILHPRK